MRSTTALEINLVEEVTEPIVSPQDSHNQRLLDNTHPDDWKNPEPQNPYNLVVIGAGSAGLVAAAGAAGLGARVALIEKHLMGGDCLNYGCVPSKGVIRSAHAYADVMNAGQFGIRYNGPVEVDFAAVMGRMRSLRADISRHDSVHRFKRLGVDVFLGAGQFTGPDTIEVGGETLRFAKALVATGGRPAVPEIPGLEEAGYLTNTTIFNLTERPGRLAVIGGGPIGCELAQTFQRLGSDVVLFHRGAHLLNKEDGQAAEVVQAALRRDGVELALGSSPASVTVRDGQKILHYETKGGEKGKVMVDEILVAAGRSPHVWKLGLKEAGVKFDPRKGVEVDDRFQTTNPRVYAAGDVCSRYQFTHAADFMARAVLRNALFKGKEKASDLLIPRATYTDPQIATVGLTMEEAAHEGIEVDIIQQSFEDVDRAVLDGETDGFAKALVKKGTDEIVGATIVARHAGDMIGMYAMAMRHGLGLGKVAQVIQPYPTQAEAIRKTGDAYNRTRLTPRVRRLFGWWLRWQRGR